MKRGENLDAEILDDLKHINVLLAKQEQSIRQITQVNHTQNVQYVQQIHNIQHIQQIQSRVNAQVEKTGTALKKTSGLFGGFKTVAATVGGAITGAFSALGAGGFLAEAVTEADALADKFLVLRLSLGKLKSALGEAVAPIISAFLPVVQQAVYAATRWVKSVGKVVAALFGGTVQTEDMAAAQEELAVSSGKAARSLASFDEIERLDKGSGGSGGAVESAVTIPKAEDALSPQLQAVVETIRAAVEKIKELLAPLKRIDLSPAGEAFRDLGLAVAQFAGTALKNLEWAWHNLLVPLAKWTIEEAAPGAVHVLTQAFSALSAILGPVLEGIKSLLPGLQPVAQFLGQTVTGILNTLTACLGEVAEAFTRESGHIQGIFTALGDVITQFWGWMQPVLTQIGTLFGGVMDGLAQSAQVSFSAVMGALEGLAQFVAGVFTADWDRAWKGITEAVSSIWNGLQEKLKSPLNGIIGFLNQLLMGITSGINALIRRLNALSFTVPDWVPVLGGERFGFQLSTVKTPQIPYLAQGAVLPANKPFLAVVGDQKSGTNIEAPLSTIQEAVAAVMDTQVDAMLAGFEALLQENRQLRAVVESIEVGDTVIGQAAARYDRRRALARGGVL